jgi:hypothetical protein
MTPTTPTEKKHADRISALLVAFGAAVFLLFAAADAVGCSHLGPKEELAPAQFHGDKDSPLGCICLAHKGHIVCECDQDAVRAATGIWK